MTTNLKHGKASTYEHHKCRCNLCKKAATEKMKKYRQTASGHKKMIERGKKQRKLQQLALEYVKTTHPTVYKRLKKQVEQ